MEKNILDDIPALRKLDPNNALGSVESFPDQLSQIWQETSQLTLPKTLRGKSCVVVAGMGGSALGGRVVSSLLEPTSQSAFYVTTEYHLPSFVNQDSLVVIATYSGNTEETLGCLNDAIKQKAAVVCLTTGGRAGELIRTGKIAGHIFTPRFNPLGYPKTAIGYSVGGLLGILTSLGYTPYTDSDFQRALKEFTTVQKTFRASTPTSRNPIKKLARATQGKIVAFVASEHLRGAAYTAKNQLNEIWHSGALFFDLPEMNHHLVEAFGKPKPFKEGLAYVLLDSSHYHPRNRQRYMITKRVLKKVGTQVESYSLQTNSMLAQAFEVINLGGFLSVYGSLADGEDPGPEPWIIYFKKQLGAPTH